MSKPYTQSRASYNPFKDQVSTPLTKMHRVFTAHQDSLLEKPTVSKSLLTACLKAVRFKEAFDKVAVDWVGKPTQDFIAAFPVILES